MSVVIKKCSISEIEANPNFLDLHQEYWDESAVVGLPPPNEKMAVYKLIENEPSFTAFGAFIDDSLIGFVVVLTTTIPHYGAMIAVTESLFVGKAYRRTGAGLKLIRTAQRYARNAGSPAIAITAPYGGQLSKVLPLMGYRKTNETFLRSFGDE